MTANRSQLVGRILAMALLFGFSVPASAISLILPAVQAAPQEIPSEPLKVEIDRLGSFEATAIGDLPIFELDPLADILETPNVDEEAEVQTEMISMNLTGRVLLAEGIFDVFIELYPPDPIVPGILNFTTTAISDDGSSASGDLQGAYNFIVEVALIDVTDPRNVTTFMHSDSLFLSGLWHSEGRKLVIDSPLVASGMIEGNLAVVPLPAGALLFLSGVFVVGLVRRRRKTAFR